MPGFGTPENQQVLDFVLDRVPSDRHPRYSRLRVRKAQLEERGLLLVLGA